ncbi:MAG TPA: hypothetical protein VFD56_01720 [Chitinophagaceae bacterium]|nr:hypothetical protein [Chitinophagaceae bacterium]
MNAAKIRLSPNEMDLVTNAEWILTKNGIMRKAWHLLEGLQEYQQDLIISYQKELPPQALLVPAKISKGENYRGLPYLVLDYPRFFEKENAFAIRTMFWWGHFFSITLHLSGNMKALYIPSLLQGYRQLADNSFYFSTNDEEWEHHFESDNYSLLHEITEKQYREQLQERPFIKLAQKVELVKWNDAHDILAKYYSELVGLLHHQLPSR